MLEGASLKHTQPPSLYVHKVEKKSKVGVIYNKVDGELQEDMNLNLEGPCRLEFRDGKIFEGNFQGGVCEKTRYYRTHLHGYLEGRFDMINLMHGVCDEFDKRGNLIFRGEFQGCQRNSEGTEFYQSTVSNLSRSITSQEEVGFGSSQGTWLRGKRTGKFIQNTHNYTVRGEGWYQDDTKVGEWTYTRGQETQKTLVDYGSENKRGLRTQESSPARQPSQQQFEPYHRLLITEGSLQVVAKSDRMLVDDVISGWAMILQSYLSFSRNPNILVLTIDHLMLFAGLGLNQRCYEKVRPFTKHLINSVNMLRLANNQQSKKILFPIIKYYHFSLAVVEITRTSQEKMKIECHIYDSLGYPSYPSYSSYPSYPSYPSYQGYSSYSGPSKDVRSEAIRAYLTNYAMSFPDPEMGEYLKEMITIPKDCAKQSDGISCGVFVCVFMYCLCMGLDVPKKFSLKQISEFRTTYLFDTLRKSSMGEKQMEGISNFINRRKSIRII